MSNSSYEELDSVDLAILQLLQADGRISNVDLATQIKLSPPATHARLKRLQTKGYIRQFTALLDQEKVGFDMTCFVNISLRMHGTAELQEFRSSVLKMRRVLECYQTTGEFDYLLKIVVHNRRDLQHFVENSLSRLPGVARIHTSLVLDEIKCSTELPIGAV
jgi:Lrp/AsnC family transcriptional regulator, leucine-responsive regulatory protein